MKAAISIALACAVFQTSVSLADLTRKMCPLDRVIFKDQKSGREFVALKVGLNQEYRCGDAPIYHHPQKRLEEKCGPALGDTVIVGRLNNSPVVAVYNVIRGVPCCSWRSYRRVEDAPLSPKLTEWLKPHEMPFVVLGSESDEITENPDLPDYGPLHGGDFIPMKCRALK